MKETDRGDGDTIHGEDCRSYEAINKDMWLEVKHGGNFYKR